MGDFTITLTDQINERTYPDSVVQACSNFDSHGYTVDPVPAAGTSGKKGVDVYIPYRAMLPKGLDGLLVTGLSISAHRDAVPLIRMQPDIQNGGYAAGVAAAMAAEAGDRAAEHRPQEIAAAPGRDRQPAGHRAGGQGLVSAAGRADRPAVDGSRRTAAAPR